MLTSRRVKLAPELTKNEAANDWTEEPPASSKSNSGETILTHLMTHTASEQQCDEDDETENSAEQHRKSAAQDYSQAAESFQLRIT